MALPARLRVLKLGSGRYDFVSLADDVRVTAPAELDGALDALLARLAAGPATMLELTQADAEEQAAGVRDLLDDLVERGVVVVTEEVRETVPTRRDRHADQNRFFANFKPLPAAPPSEGSLSRPEVAGGSHHPFQEALLASTVLVMGLGRIGSRLAGGLATAGVGRVMGSDPSPVREVDLFDSAYTSADLHRPRSEAAAGVVAAAGRSYTPVPGDDWPLDEVDLLVLCEDTHDPGREQQVNRRCVEGNMRLLSYRNLGLTVEIGPFVVPRQTACLACLDARLLGNAPAHRDVRDQRARLAAEGLSLGRLNITLGYELLALEVLKILSGFSRPKTYSSVHVFDVLTFEGRMHPVLKVPRCAVCGGRGDQRPSWKIWYPEASA